MRQFIFYALIALLGIYFTNMPQINAEMQSLGFPEDWVMFAPIFITGVLFALYLRHRM